jgi:Raf kinase inhibitor-like YbhB/YbcL family protein
LTIDDFHQRGFSMSRHVTSALLVAMLAALSSAGAQKAAKFTVTSPDLHEGQKMASAQVFNGMGCTGSNTSPALEWHGAPANTKSYAITLYDPDAPTGSGWWHWVVYNIPGSVTKLAAGAGDPKKNLLPPGAAQGNTDFGAPGYGGACPPAGDKPHHYHLTVFALDTDKLDIPATATAAYVGFNLHAHTVAKAELNTVYGR